MHKNVPHQKLYQMPITWKFTLIAKLTRGQFLPMNIEHKLRRPICGILWDDVFFDWQNRPGKWINTMALSDCLIKAKNVWHLELSAKARVIPLDKLSALLTTTSASLWPPHGLQLCDPENKSWRHWFAFAFRETKHFLKLKVTFDKLHVIASGWMRVQIPSCLSGCLARACDRPPEHPPA